MGPVWWEELNDEHWWIALRCGECGMTSEQAVTTQSLTISTGSSIEHETRSHGEADRLGMEILATQADALAVALERDLIGVDDFARG